ncbi:MAG: DNA polymerase III subunit delta [Planctomycetota bacterium]
MAESSPKPVYVVFGSDAFLRDTYRRQVVEAVLGDADPQLCVSRFDAEAELADVLDDLRTLPFLAPRRLVIVDDADAFITAHRSALEDYLEHPAPTGTLLLCPRSFPANTKIAKRVAAIGEAFDCSPPEARRIPQWIAKRATRDGKEMGRRAIDLMAQWLGPDLARIDSEMTKLALYVGDRPTVTAEDVSAVVVATADVSPFALTDALTAGDASTALATLEKLLTRPGEEFRVLGLIGWHLRRVLKAKQMLIAGRREADVFKTVRVFGRGQPAMRRLLQRRSLGQVGRDFRELIRTDLAMKTGRDARAALQRLVVALCQ